MTRRTRGPVVSWLRLWAVFSSAAFLVGLVLTGLSPSGPGYIVLVVAAILVGLVLTVWFRRRRPPRGR